MRRSIAWKSGLLDEIELIYEKAEENDQISSLLEQLEAKALVEAKANCNRFQNARGEKMTPDQFDNLTDNNKENAIVALGDTCIDSMHQNLENAILSILLTPAFVQVQACAIFCILNRLEKLDGAINILHPKWSLELQMPPAGSRGMVAWEMLIMLLYPWLSVHETRSVEISGTESAVQTEVKEKCSSALPPKELSKKEKRSFWQKLFGK